MGFHPIHARLRHGLVALFAGVGIALAPPAAAQEQPAVIIVDAATGIVLHAADPAVRWFPASLAKVMTVYVAFAEIEAGRLGLDDEITASVHAALQSPTEIGIGAGQTIAVRTAILAIIHQSANDVAVALAEHIAVDEVSFAKRMTTTAEALGMTRTRFRNASGLPDGEQFTTAADMAILGLALLRDFPQYYQFFSETSFTFDGQGFGTINGILSRYPGADGIKTGFTCGSGYNLVASAVRDGRRLIGVVLGGASNDERHAEMGRLLDRGFATAIERLKRPLYLAHVTLPDGKDEPPPLQFSAAECAYGVGSSSPAAGLTGGGLAGWGIVFGAFPQKAQAQKILRAMRSSLAGVVPDGRGVIVPRSWEGLRRYSALVVGLNKEQAGKACKHLWSLGAYCLALNPTALNNPKAVWR